MTQPKYYLAGELTDELVKHKLAINEEGILGVILNVKQLGPTKVYVGFELNEMEEWVSLIPSVLYGAVHPLALMEFARILVPPVEEKTIKIQTTNPTHFFGPYGPAAWNTVTLNDKEKGDFKDIMSKFFLADPNNNINPFKDTDFKLDNEAEDDNNK